MGSPVIRLCCHIVYFNHFNNHNHIGVATLRGCSPLVKDQDTLIGQSVTQINKAHRKQVVYDEFMKQIRTARHSFNMANYRVRLAVPPSTTNNHNIVKKLTNKYTKNVKGFWKITHTGTNDTVNI